MRILLNRNTGNKVEEIEITDFCSNIQWSGDKNQISRKFEFAMVSPVHDRNQPIISAAVGNLIQVIEDGVEIFRGIIFSRDKSVSSQQIRVVAYDHLFYMINNFATYNFKSMSPENIAQKVCGDFGIPIGSFQSTGKNINLIVKGESLIKIILKAYQEAGKETGKVYYPIVQEGNISVIEKGATILNYTVDADTNIIDASYGESIESMVNMVAIYDDQGNFITSVNNEQWMKTYGQFQQVYEKNDQDNYMDVGKNMLNGMQQTMQVTFRGNINCRTGYAVKVREPYTGLIGIFYIDSDNHTWNNSDYETQLSLNLKNIMEG